MRKKWVLSLCICLCLILLSGCTKNRDLTDDEQNLVAEYIAGRLQQNDSEYEWPLVVQDASPTPQATDQSQPTAPPAQTEAPVAEQTETQSKKEEKKDQVHEVSLDELYHVQGMSVSYGTYTVCSEYNQRSSASQMTAKKGEKLFIVSFIVKNTSSQKLKLNLLKRKISYSINMDGAVYEPTIAFLKNGGLNCLRTTLKPNSEEKAILVYNILEQSKKAKSIVITAQDGKNASKIKVK